MSAKKNTEREQNLSRILHEYYFKALELQLAAQSDSHVTPKETPLYHPDTFLRMSP